MKIYQVSTNLYNLEVIEIDIVRKTDTYYWRNDKNRAALDGIYHKSFNTKKEAIEHLKYLIEAKITSTRRTLEMHHKKLAEFATLYPDY